MANENAPIGQVNAANLIGQFKPQTDATSNFVQALRAGVINANDIQQGVDRHQQAKVQLSAQQLALAEASNPDAMALRQAQTQLGLAQTRGALELEPLNQRSKEATLKGIIWGSKMQQLGVSAATINTLAEEGFPLNLNYDRDPTPEDAENIKTYVDRSAEWHAATARRLAVDKAANPGQKLEDPVTKAITFLPILDNEPLTKAEIEEAKLFGAKYRRAGDWFRAGSPRTSTKLFPGAAGVVSGAKPATRPPPVVAPLGQVGEGTVLRPPDDSAPVSPEVVRRGKEQVGPIRPGDSTITFGEAGMTINYGSSRLPNNKPMTESERKTGTTVARMKLGEDRMDYLVKNGFDPAGYSEWLQGLLPDWAGQYKTEEVRAWNAASSLWIQGLLRLESGAAIAYKEQAWYVKTFFPGVKDSPAVQAQKRASRLELRNYLESSLPTYNQEAAQKYKPDFAAEYEGLRLKAEARVKGATGGVPAAAAGPAKPILTSNRSFTYNPQTRRYIVGPGK